MRLHRKEQLAKSRPCPMCGTLIAEGYRTSCDVVCETCYRKYDMRRLDEAQADLYEPKE